MEGSTSVRNDVVVQLYCGCWFRCGFVTLQGCLCWSVLGDTSETLEKPYQDLWDLLLYTREMRKELSPSI